MNLGKHLFWLMTILFIGKISSAQSQANVVDSREHVSSLSLVQSNSNPSGLARRTNSLLSISSQNLFQESSPSSFQIPIPNLQSYSFHAFNFLKVTVQVDWFTSFQCIGHDLSIPMFSGFKPNNFPWLE